MVSELKKTAIFCSLLFTLCFVANNTLSVKNDKCLAFEHYNDGEANYIDMDGEDYCVVRWEPGNEYQSIDISGPDGLFAYTVISGGQYYTFIDTSKISEDDSNEDICLFAYTEYDEQITVIIFNYCTDDSSPAGPPSSSSTVTTTPHYTTSPYPSYTCTSAPIWTTGTISTTAPSATYPSATTSRTFATTSGSSDTTISDSDSTDSTTSFITPISSVTSPSGLPDILFGSVVIANEYGDVNSDGMVDISDLTRLSLFLMGECELTPAEYFAANVEFNGRDSAPNLADLAKLKQFICKEKIILGPDNSYVYR